MGDIRTMSFEEYFERFLNDRGHHGNGSKYVKITQEDFKTLKSKVEKYEALVEKHKEVKTQNDKLLKELDDMKDDGRKFKELLEEKEKFLNSLLRIQAEFENYKKRTERDNHNYKTYVLEGFLRKLINHYDDLIRALNLMKVVEGIDGIKKGFELVVKNFEKLMLEEGVKPMNSKGDIFDPYKHEAIMIEEGQENLPENTIIEELERGYYYNNKVLRPAKVKISKQSKLLKLKEKIEINQQNLV